MNKSGLKLVYWFHGHSCPMSTLGYRAGVVAKKLLKVKRKDYYKVSVKVFFKSCAVDGIQISFPATYANGNLTLQDEKRFAFEFLDNEKKRGVSITFNKPLLDFMERYAHIKKTEKDEKKIIGFFKKFIKYTQSAKLNDIFIIKEI
ncbi:MAG: formylmethanofuran dehydrogenase subunit E family protein [Proteobacteria bacterium]|nr:formylmethanofuran dehydrogenase subunit E family protein [Pseudomonadota bacterium]